MHRWSRRVGRSIDTTQTATLVTRALDMTIRNRGAQPGVVTHSDHGAKPRLTPRAFADCAQASGLVPSFWGRMHHRRRHSALGAPTATQYDLASTTGQPPHSSSSGRATFWSPSGTGSPATLSASANSRLAPFTGRIDRGVPQPCPASARTGLLTS
jgi:hypothetical protein